VICDTVYGYEYVKTTGGGVLPRERIVPAHGPVKRDAKRFTDFSRWHKLYNSLGTDIPPPKRPRAWRQTPAVHHNVWVASGEKVMGDGELVELHVRHDQI